MPVSNDPSPSHGHGLATQSATSGAGSTKKSDRPSPLPASLESRLQPNVQNSRRAPMRRAFSANASREHGSDVWQHGSGAWQPGIRQPMASTSKLRVSTSTITPDQLAFAALQFLPSPVLILDSLKVVVMANGAMGRLLGMTSEKDAKGETLSATEKLRGQSLPQVGIDMIQDGRPVRVDWDKFLDQVIVEMEPGKTKETGSVDERGPSIGKDDPEASTISGTIHRARNAVVEVIVSQKGLNRTNFDSRLQSNESAFQSYAKMFITVFEAGGAQTYFNLTFANSDLAPARISNVMDMADSRVLDAAEPWKITSSSSPASVITSHASNSSSYVLSPSGVSVSSAPFPPPGPSSSSTPSSTLSILQRITIMKDALLDNTEIPIIAMWKDGSVILPNKGTGRSYDLSLLPEAIAALTMHQLREKLFSPDTDFDAPVEGVDLLPAWDMWNEDFTRPLTADEYPLSILIRTEIPFAGQRIGMRDENGRGVVFDILGEAIRDNETGNFLAGVVTCRDVTKHTDEIDKIKAADAERFKLICDTMPQLVWTANPDGSYDFFNDQWYRYTGLSREDSLGQGWTWALHPDDLGGALKIWKRSLETGEPYMAEFRCRSKAGQWRWFLARALPQRSKENGKIEKWFGTSTDVNDSTEAKLGEKRMRQQLLSVITHSHITIFNIDTDRRVTMLEGALSWDSTVEDSASGWYIGKNVYEVFNRLNSALAAGQKPQFLLPIEAILEGNSAEDLQEHEIEGRWYRTRFLPVLSKKNRNGSPYKVSIEGVTGVILDVTELKAKEADIATQALEKQQLISNEAAAKEASRLKSQFLANMSHEIRTPITGVIGMAELLKDLPLGEEQHEYTENICRSANTLLTVINDVLDFSKVESGRLDIEEVQFSMSLVVSDVTRIVRYAAQKKSLEFISEISPSIERDMVVIGDPGRVRQIITNLLTNSMKFTSQGYVKFSVLKEKETDDTIEIRFVVEDTGVGIEEEVRQKLFQPFSQGDSSTARKFGGTGLGLTICKSLLDLMRGRMTLESTLDAGTTATFWIPFSKPQSGQPLVQIDALPDRLVSEMSMSCNSSEFEQTSGAPPAEIAVNQLEKTRAPRRHSSLGVSGLSTTESNIPASERANTHVLVVEDNVINQQIATKTIQKLGFKVTAAWNGKDALAYLDRARNGKETKPDIILMDVQMPIIDGYRCTHFLRHHAPYSSYVRDVPIVAMTASAIQGDKEKCEKAGMDDYMSKPVKSTMLERMLLRWLGNRREELLGRMAYQRSLDVSPPPSSVCPGVHCSSIDVPGLTISRGQYPSDSDTSESDVISAAAVSPSSPVGLADGDSSSDILGERPSLSTSQVANEKSSSETTDHSSGLTISMPEEDWQQRRQVNYGQIKEAGTATRNATTSPTVVEMRPPDSHHSQRRVSVEEQALHSRDDKLIGAANGRSAYHNHHQFSAPSTSEGQRLTRENMGKLRGQIERADRMR